MGHRCADGQERALEVDVEGAVPLLRRQILDGCPDPVDAGVREDDVEAAETIDRGPDRALHVLPRRHVAAHERGPASPCLDLLARRLALVVLEVGEHDVGALLGEAQRDAPADPARPARHEGHPPVQQSHVRPPVVTAGTGRARLSAVAVPGAPRR
jgi:hypothetical protein